MSRSWHICLVRLLADVYHATHTYDGKPKVAGYESGSRFVNKTELIGGRKLLPQPLILIVLLLNHKLKRLSQSLSLLTMLVKNTLTNVRCFNCNQLGHTRNLCPNRALGNASYTSRKVVTSARVQAYAVGNTNSMTPVSSNSCVYKVGHVQSPAAQSSVGEWSV